MRPQQHGRRVQPQVQILDESTRLMCRIVKLVYEDELTQTEAVETLKREGLRTSAASVSRALQRARDQGVVEPDVAFPEIFGLEDDLRSAWGLLEARVVFVPEPDPKRTAIHLGQAAATYLRNLFDPDQVSRVPGSIGIAGGFTLHQMVCALPEEQAWEVDIYAISIECMDELEITSAVNAALLRQKCPSSRAYSIQLPVSAGLPLSQLEAALTSVLDYKSARRTFESAQSAEVVVTGLGDAADDSRIAQACRAGGEDIETLRSTRGVVGDINLTPFDEHGEVVGCELSRRNFGVKGERFRELAELKPEPGQVAPKVLVVAGGLNKRQALLGALRGRFCNVLITDESCATYLIEEGRSQDGRSHDECRPGRVDVADQVP